MEEYDLQVNRSRSVSRNLPDKNLNLHFAPSRGLIETPDWILLGLEGAKAPRALLPTLVCQQPSWHLK